MKMRLVLGVLVVVVSALPALAKPPVTVDCTKGQKIQDAVDKNAPPLAIEVHGVCVENVSIVGKDFSLKGADPATDGIQGVSVTDPNVYGALMVNKVVIGSIANLSVSNGPKMGLAVYDSQVDLQNCRFNGNGSSGLHVSAGSYVTGNGVTSSSNGGRGAQVQRGAQFQCDACRFENNVNYAVAAQSGASCIVGETVITGGMGMLANGGGSVVEMYCSGAPAAACSLNITQRAASASQDGRAYLYGVGDFHGQLDVSGGTLTLAGSRQLPWSTPPTLYNINRVNSGGYFLVTENEDEYGNITQSQLALQTNVAGFAHLVVQSSTNVAANVLCAAAGDAWLDPTVTKAAGVTVSGCEHAP